MANLSSQATLPTSAATGNIDLIQLSALIGNITSTVLRQVLTVGDPVSGQNIASVVPDEPQGWEAGLVVNMVYSKQLRDINDTLQKVLTELQCINYNTGGLPQTERMVG